MGTNPITGGTDPQDILDGKAAYVNASGLPISTGGYEWGDVDLDDLADNLNAGGDVEILLQWNGGGGHAVMVVSIVHYSDGSYDITYIEDGTQADGDPENHEVTIHVAANGTFAGGWVFGFVSEYMYASPFLSHTDTGHGTIGLGKSFVRRPPGGAMTIALCRPTDLRSEIFGS